MIHAHHVIILFQDLSFFVVHIPNTLWVFAMFKRNSQGCILSVLQTLKPKEVIKDKVLLLAQMSSIEKKCYLSLFV